MAPRTNSSGYKEGDKNGREEGAEIGALGGRKEGEGWRRTFLLSLPIYFSSLTAPSKVGKGALVCPSVCLSVCPCVSALAWTGRCRPVSGRARLWYLLAHWSPLAKYIAATCGSREGEEETL